MHTEHHVWIASKEDLCPSRGQRGLAERVEHRPLGQRSSPGGAAGGTLQPLPAGLPGGPVTSGSPPGGLPPYVRGTPRSFTHLVICFAPMPIFA